MTARSLIFSDGTPSFFFADPQTFAITREVKIKSDRPGEVAGLNELELIDGKLYGNIFMSNTILRIDPASGCIEASADMGSLWRSMTDADKKQVTGSEQNVLNGIAYDKASGLFYVTGKTLADDLRRQVQSPRSRRERRHAAASALSAARGQEADLRLRHRTAEQVALHLVDSRSRAAARIALRSRSPRRSSGC